MKFSLRQILASAAGAVLAALIASAFGVKGTVVGVAIGSAAATFGTAIVAQSLERGHEAMRQAVVRAPEDSVLRKLGSTAVGGDALTEVDQSSAAPTEQVASGATTGAVDETTQMETSSHAVDRTAPLEVTAGGGSAATRRIQTTASLAPATPRRFTWKAIAGTAGVVFLVALLFVTAVELLAGKPLSSIFGHGGTGSSVGDLIGGNSSPSSTTTTTTTSTTTTNPSPSTSTTTTTSTTGTSSTSSTTSTVPPSSTTTTTHAGGTTTTAPGATTSTTSAGGSKP